MTKFRCRECQAEFEEEEEAEFHSYDAHNMEFEDCIQEVEEENLIDDSPEEEENLDEIDSISEEELKDLTRAKLSVDAYMEGELGETEEKMLLSRLMGQTTGKAHDKVFPEKANTSNAFKMHYQEVIEKLSDVESTVCPICNEEWTQIAKKETTILSDDKSKVGIPLVRVIHIKTKHIPIWNLIADLFGMSAEKIPDERVSTVPNPESCSELDTLSKEELSEIISSDENLRHEFFREWLRRLKNRE